MPVTARISMPEQANQGEVLEVKTLVSHPMESGFRRDGMGESIPRNILRRFTVEYAGETPFEIAFGPGVAANPFTAFFIRATVSGTVKFIWEDQDGEVTTMQHFLTVQ